jgi:hypothetical protein
MLSCPVLPGGHPGPGSTGLGRWGVKGAEDKVHENFFLQKSKRQLDTPVVDNKPILHLKNLTREDSGMYSCMATNGAGYPARDTIMLVVQCEF